MLAPTSAARAKRQAFVLGDCPASKAPNNPTTASSITTTPLVVLPPAAAIFRSQKFCTTRDVFPGGACASRGGNRDRSRRNDHAGPAGGGYHARGSGRHRRHRARDDGRSL